MPRRIATIGRAVLLATAAASLLAQPPHDGGGRRGGRPAIDPRVAAAFAAKRQWWTRSDRGAQPAGSSSAEMERRPRKAPASRSTYDAA